MTNPSTARKFKRKGVGACLLAIALLAAATAMAAEPRITVDRLFLSASMLVDAGGNQARGLTQTFAIPDKLLLAVPLEYEIVWDEQTDKVKVSREEFSLKAEDGTVSPVLGEMKYYAAFDGNFSGISASRPGKWRDTPTKKTLFPVFAVAATGGASTLKVGTVEIAVRIPDKAEDLGPLNLASYSVVTAGKVESLPAELKLGQETFATTLRPISDSLLAVTVRIEPREPTVFSREHFFWHTSWFGIRDEHGNYAPVAGELFFNKLNDNVSHNKTKGADGWNLDEATLYFSVAANTSRYKLYCLGRPVANFSLGGD